MRKLQIKLEKRRTSAEGLIYWHTGILVYCKRDRLLNGFIIPLICVTTVIHLKCNTVILIYCYTNSHFYTFTVLLFNTSLHTIEVLCWHMLLLRLCYFNYLRFPCCIHAFTHIRPCLGLWKMRIRIRLKAQPNLASNIILVLQGFRFIKYSRCS